MKRNQVLLISTKRKDVGNVGTASEEGSEKDNEITKDDAKTIQDEKDNQIEVPM